MKIAHIVNPVIVLPSSDLYVAQPITFEAMRNAQEFAQRYQLDVDLYAAQYSEDQDLVPDYLIRTPNLETSILDFGIVNGTRKLPLIRDILDRLFVQANDADYFIYSNVDIAPMPFFYVCVKSLIEKGFDAFTINRRTVSKEYQDLSNLGGIYSDYGDKHPGHDCFVFHREKYPSYQLLNACIGAGGIGKILILNLICHAKKFQLFKDLHLTFHIGDDRSSSALNNPANLEYNLHNSSQLRGVIQHYREQNKLVDHRIIRKMIERLYPDQDIESFFTPSQY
jgi:hypothetical protein